MLNSYSYKNNVLTTLYVAINAGDTTLSLARAAAPMNDPPVVGAGQAPARFTLVDDPVNPTKIEVIEAGLVSYTALSSIVTLSYVTRGLEGTTAQSWGGGTVVMQAVTADMLNPAPLGPVKAESFAGIFAQSGAVWDYAVEFSAPVILRGGMTNVYMHLSALKVDSNIECAAVYGSSGHFSGTLTFGGSAAVSIGSYGVNTIAGGLTVEPGGPGSSTASGVPGQIRVDGNYIYVCTAVNTWKRAALSSF